MSEFDTAYELHAHCRPCVPGNDDPYCVLTLVLLLRFKGSPLIPTRTVTRATMIVTTMTTTAIVVLKTAHCSIISLHSITQPTEQALSPVMTTLPCLHLLLTPPGMVDTLFPGLLTPCRALGDSFLNPGSRSRISASSRLLWLISLLVSFPSHPSFYHTLAHQAI